METSLLNTHICFLIWGAFIVSKALKAIRLFYQTIDYVVPEVRDNNPDKFECLLFATKTMNQLYDGLTQVKNGLRYEIHLAAHSW